MDKRTVPVGRPPRLLSLRSSRSFITMVVVIMAFTDVLFYGLAVPLMPTLLRERVHVPEEDVQLWDSILIGAYGGAVFLSSPIFGYIADCSSLRRTPLLFGILALALSTVLLHLGSSIFVLALARTLQGLSASAIYTAGFALLFDTVGVDEVGEALGWVSTGLVGGSFLGRSLGGILYRVGGETAVFGLGYGVLAVDVVLRLAVIEKDTAKQWALPTKGHTYGSIPEQCTNAVDGHERGKPAKLSIFRLLTIPRLLTACFGWFVVGSFLTAFDGVLPIFVEEHLGWSTAGAGIVFLAIFIPHMIGSPLAGRVVDTIRNGPRLLAAFGFLLCAPLFVLLRLADDYSASAPVVLLFLLGLIGIGIGVAGPPLMKEISQVISSVEKQMPDVFGPKGATAQTYGLFNSALAAGNFIGPIWAGAMKTALGWSNMSLVLGVSSAVTGVLMGAFLEGWVGRSDVLKWERERSWETERLVDPEC